MKQKTLSIWLKFIILGCAFCGLMMYAIGVPTLGQSIVALDSHTYAAYYLPWLIFIWLTAIPCYLVLIFAWKIARNIENDRSFCIENAGALKRISTLAVIDSVFFLLGNIVMFLLNMNHPSIVLFSLLIVFVGIAIAVTTTALSHLVDNCKNKATGPFRRLT